MLNDSTTHPCECGCGQPCPDFDKKGRPRRFLNFHFFKAERFSFPGSAHPNWKGGRGSKDGYVRVTTHPKTRKREHRVIWEQANGPIPDGYVIHHVNGNRADNRLENLQCISHSDHSHLENGTAGGRWSRDHICCVECGTTERKHKSFGYCANCDARRRLRIKQPT